MGIGLRVFLESRLSYTNLHGVFVAFALIQIAHIHGDQFSVIRVSSALIVIRNRVATQKSLSQWLNIFRLRLALRPSLSFSLLLVERRRCAGVNSSLSLYKYSSRRAEHPETFSRN